MLRFIVLFAVVQLFSCAGNSSKEVKVIQDRLADGKTTAAVITNRHVKIPKSHLYIIPPNGFTANNAAGTLIKSEAYAHFIMMNIVNGSNRENYFSEMKAEADRILTGRWKQEDIIVDGHSATVYQFKKSGILQHYLAFTDGYTNEMLVANYEENETALASEMYEAMKTAVVKK